MTLTLGQVGASTDFAISTHRCDRVSAELHLAGHLDDHGVAVLRAVVDTHLRDGRRFLRLDVRRVCAAERGALRLIAELHRHLLDRRGTLILTGVTAALETVLATAEAELFLIAPTAADQLV
ncbi:MAG TPA: STAS domain-containing protein [Jatrophihabitantaceae bacterium]|jgi:ABC-type transporter Mla MlaB component